MCEPNGRLNPAPKEISKTMSAAGHNSSLGWSASGRTIVFLLAATSIGSLLAEFYGLLSMRAFVGWVFLPALAVLVGLGAFDRLRGDGRLFANLVIGAVSGLLAAGAYDLCRLPFVFAEAWGIDAVVPPLDLLKVFPMFGAMIGGEPLEPGAYSVTAHLLGWLYHFSNGMTFGIMYLALIGDGARRHWLWAVLLAGGLEVGMLLTPYPTTFGIDVTPTFVAVTLAAHGIFGVALGLSVRVLARRR